MRHLLFYSQLVDMPFLTILQAERIHHEEIQHNAQWHRTHAFRRLFQNPPDLSQSRMPTLPLNYGLCIAIVFFIFKMLYSRNPDCGLYWAKMYRENLSEPLFYRERKQGEDRVHLNLLMDEFLALFIRMVRLRFSEKELSSIAVLKNMVEGRSPEAKSLSLELGLDSKNIATCRNILDSKMKILQHVQEKWERSIIDRTLSSELLNPMPQGEPKIEAIFSALKMKSTNRADPNLISMLFHEINEIPASCWAIIHHFAYINHPQNVLFPSINILMDLQEMNSKRLERQCIPPLKDLVTISSAHATKWERNKIITTALILYENFVRSQSLTNRSFEESFVLYKDGVEISLGQSFTTQIDLINVDFKSIETKYPQCPIANRDDEYSINYFVTIGTDDYMGCGHIICCWKETHRTPNGGMQTATFFFDPNNGLFQLDVREDIGTAIVNFICKFQMTPARPKLYLDMMFFRGFN